MPKSGRHQTSRDADLVSFWSAVLPELRRRVPLFEGVRPLPYPFIKKMHRGITVRLNIKLDHASVWLYVYRSSKEDSEAVFRKILLARKEIEGRFADGMGWDDRPAKSWDSLYLWGWANKTHGLVDSEQWPEVQGSLVDATVRLIKAVKPYLPESDWDAS